MSFANINIGTTPDDHTGDPLRVAFAKINQNFANITAGGSGGVNTVAGRAGNVILSVNDVVGAVGIGQVTGLVANALVSLNTVTTTNLTAATSTVLAEAEAYTDSAIGNLTLNAPAGLQTIKQLADAIGDDPNFILQVTSAQNGLNLANVAIANNTSNIAYIMGNINAQAGFSANNFSSIIAIQSNVYAANSAITALQSNAAIQSIAITNNATNIGLVNANVTAANSAITALQTAGYATQSYVDTQVVNLINSAPGTLNTLKELADAINDDNNFATHILASVGNINANVTAANSAITSLQVTTASQTTAINTNTSDIATINANVVAANLAISGLQSNTGTLASEINSSSQAISLIQGNVTAANLAISALQSNAATQSIAITNNTTSINLLNANVTAANTSISEIEDDLGEINSNLANISGTLASLNSDVTTLFNDLTTGSANITVGNVKATGFFYANGMAFVGGGGGNVTANTGNISFNNTTISTINDAGGNFGITLNPANGGEVHIDSNTGINNTNPAYWLEVGNTLDNVNTGQIAVDFSNGAGYNGTALMSWEWSDGQGHGTNPNASAYSKFGVYKGGDLTQPLLTIDPTNSITSLGTTLQVPAGNVLTTSIMTGSNVFASNVNGHGIPLYVTRGTSGVNFTTTSTDDIARFVGVDSGNAIVSINGYGANFFSAPTLDLTSTGGNVLVRTPTQSGDVIGRIRAKGYGNTAYTGVVSQIAFQAEAPFTDTIRPSSIVFYTSATNTMQQAGRFSSTGNLVLNSGTQSTGITSGALVINGHGGAGIAGNVNAGNLISAGSVIGTNASFGSLNSGTVLLSSAAHSNDINSGALIVQFGGAAIGGNLNVGGNFTANGATTLGGIVTITSTDDTGNVQSFLGGALQVDGGATIGGNVLVGNQLFVGNIGPNVAPFPLINPTITSQTSSQAGAGIQFTQIALVNSSSMGSSDYIAYGSNYALNNGDHGWMDMGFTGPSFNDPDFTITKSNDGYLFTGAVSGSTLGGNLVLATDYTGTYGDIVFATSSFYANAEVARFHGNVGSNGYFILQPTSPATSTTTGALRVKGGVGIAGNTYIGGTLVVAAGNAPSSSSAPGTTGQVAYDSNFVYVCVATNTWKRSALTTW